MRAVTHFKKIMFMRGRFLILPAFVLSFAALNPPLPAQAGFVIETVTTGPTLKTTDFSLALAIPRFDTTLGSLQDVIISDTDNSKIIGSITNTAASAESLTVSEGTVYSLTLGSNLLLTNTLMASESYTSLTRWQAATFGDFRLSGSAGSLTLTSGAIFNTFLETNSNIMVDFSTLTTSTVVGGGGNIKTGITTRAGAIVTVRYDYINSIQPLPPSPVPEPSSMLMTTLGGLLASCAGLVGRRRRAVSRA
jgi:hypothetical protein